MALSQISTVFTGLNQIQGKYIVHPERILMRVNIEKILIWKKECSLAGGATVGGGAVEGATVGDSVVPDGGWGDKVVPDGV